MRFVASAFVAATLVLGASAVSAQSAAPQIPTPVNPAPLNPVSTNGQPMSYADVPAEGVSAGRSIASPLDGFVGIVPNTIGGIFSR